MARLDKALGGDVPPSPLDRLFEMGLAFGRRPELLAGGAMGFGATQDKYGDAGFEPDCSWLLGLGGAVLKNKGGSWTDCSGEVPLISQRDDWTARPHELGVGFFCGKRVVYCKVESHESCLCAPNGMEFSHGSDLWLIRRPDEDWLSSVGQGLRGSMNFCSDGVTTGLVRSWMIPRTGDAGRDAAWEVKRVSTGLLGLGMGRSKGVSFELTSAAGRFAWKTAGLLSLMESERLESAMDGSTGIDGGCGSI